MNKHEEMYPYPASLYFVGIGFQVKQQQWSPGFPVVVLRVTPCPTFGGNTRQCDVGIIRSRQQVQEDTMVYFKHLFIIYFLRIKFILRQAQTSKHKQS